MHTGLRCFSALVLSVFWLIWSGDEAQAQSLQFEPDPLSRHSQAQQLPVSARRAQGDSHLRLELDMQAQRPHYVGFRLGGQRLVRFLGPGQHALLLPLAELDTADAREEEKDVNIASRQLEIQILESSFLSHLPFDPVRLKIRSLTFARPQFVLNPLKIEAQPGRPERLSVSASAALKAQWSLKLYLGQEQLAEYPIPPRHPHQRAHWCLNLPRRGLYRIEVVATRSQGARYSVSREQPYFLPQTPTKALELQFFSADQRLAAHRAETANCWSFPPPVSKLHSLTEQSLGVQLGFLAAGETLSPISLRASWRDAEGDVPPQAPYALKPLRAGFVYTVPPERYYIPASEGYHADPLLPLQTERGRFRINAPDRRREALYLDFSPRKDLPEGEYLLQLEVTQGQQVYRKKLRFQHHALASGSGMKTAISLYPDAVARHYANASEAYQQAQKLLWAHGISPNHLYRTQVLSPGDIEQMEALTQGQSWSNLMLWNAQTLGRWPDFKPELDSTVAYLRKHNLQSHYYFYLFDEAGLEQWPQFQRTLQLLHKHYPDIPTLSTSRLFRSVEPAQRPDLDHWVPITQELEGLKDQGFQWWYQLLVNHAPYANWFLESPLIETRLLFWQAWLYRVEGLLYYSANRWFSNPRALTPADFPYTPWNPRGFPDTNGDGYFIYPGPEVLPSLRLKALRAGQSDYALLRQAEKQLGRSTVEHYVRQVVRDLSHYQRDPQRLQHVRSELLEALN